MSVSTARSTKPCRRRCRWCGSDDVEPALDAVIAAGGLISRAIFAFPGARRFHFIDPSGSELAVWQTVDSPPE